MKSFVKVSLILMVLVSLSMAAWEYADRFPVTGGGHGIQVDPTGKIWFVSYYANDIVVNGADSIKFKSVYCFNDDGTQASFSPIRTLDVPGVGVDSMLNAGRGLGIDGQGNLLYSAYDKLYKIDYQTGECLGMVQPVPGASLTQAWGDANGYVYIGTVLAGNPIFIFDEDFEEYARVVEAADVISRALIVTPDGKDLYYSAVTGTNGVLRYHSEDGPDGTYEPVDTIGVDVDGVKVLPSINCINFDRAGNIWFASKYDVTPAGWWCVDPTQNYAVIDNLGTPLLGAQDTTDINKVSAPRGIAFNADGTVAYTSDFESPIPFRIWNYTDTPPVGDSEYRFDELVGDFTGLNPISCVVDPAGKMWAGIWLYESDYLAPLYSFYTDGSTAFEPIRSVNVDGADHLFEGACSYITRTLDGNILYTEGSYGGDNGGLFVFDYQTGDLIKGLVNAEKKYYAQCAEVSYNGSTYYIVANQETSSGGIEIFEGDLFEGNTTVYATIDNSNDGYDVIYSMAVSPDGKDIFVAGITKGVYHYHSEDGPDGEYSLLNGGAIAGTDEMDPVMVKLGPDNTLLVGSRAENNKRAGLFSLDLDANYAIIDSLETSFLLAAEAANDPQAIAYPADIAWSDDMTVMYVVDYGDHTDDTWAPYGGTGGKIQRWVLQGTDIDDARDKPGMNLKSFVLDQNYPNPFNPTTLIPFELNQNAKVTLEIYNLMGQKVVTLLDETLSAGRHQARWDATGHSTGTYLCILKADNKLQSKKMLFVK